jgi:hypothetical protein
METYGRVIKGNKTVLLGDDEEVVIDVGVNCSTDSFHLKYVRNLPKTV